ncbi:MAG: hypothetical protein JNM62_05295 [Flavobacteriales bacterium]|nr:hypothetical protein [Flavobacteriales bacterium]
MEHIKPQGSRFLETREVLQNTFVSFADIFARAEPQWSEAPERGEVYRIFLQEVEALDVARQVQPPFVEPGEEVRMKQVTRMLERLMTIYALADRYALNKGEVAAIAHDIPSRSVLPDDSEGLVRHVRAVLEVLAQRPEAAAEAGITDHHVRYLRASVDVYGSWLRSQMDEARAVARKLRGRDNEGDYERQLHACLNSLMDVDLLLGDVRLTKDQRARYRDKLTDLFRCLVNAGRDDVVCELGIGRRWWKPPQHYSPFGGMRSTSRP